MAFQTSSSSNPYKLRKHGRPRTDEFRVFFEKDGIPVSPFHDIPLYADKGKQIFNMVVEIPRWTNEKYEVMRTLFRIDLCRVDNEPNQGRKLIPRRHDTNGDLPQNPRYQEIAPSTPSIKTRRMASHDLCGTDFHIMATSGTMALFLRCVQNTS